MKVIDSIRLGQYVEENREVLSDMTAQLSMEDLAKKVGDTLDMKVAGGTLKQVFAELNVEVKRKKYKARTNQEAEKLRQQLAEARAELVMAREENAQLRGQLGQAGMLRSEPQGQAVWSQ